MRSGARSLLVASLTLFFVVALLGLAIRRDVRVRASRVSLAEIAAHYPVGSPERAMAVRREIMRRRHPRWSDLSIAEIAARLEMIARHALIRPHDGSSMGDMPSVAPFLGDYTTVSAQGGEGFLLLRENDCSLTYDSGTYSRSLSSPGYTISNTVAHYERTLHQLAGMTTIGGAFPSGCTPINGSATRALFLGKTSQNLNVFASDGYDPTTQNNALYYGTIDSSYNYHSLSVDDSNPNIHALTAGDLNKDGNGDIIELSYANCSIDVLLGKSDGTFQTPVQYACAGNSSQGAVVADLNGDGNPDVAVVSQDVNVTILLGAGDGTLHEGQTLQLPNAGTFLNGVNLIAADTRSNGRKDIVVSTGDVLLSNGDGTFTAGTKINFPTTGATSEFGPNLAGADLNKDGKLDLVYSDGYSIDIYLGNGDGTFTAGRRYATIGNVGYLTLTDIDGDGNLDVYTGMAGGPFFSGDQFEMNESYVLLGNGDGSFQGSPIAPTGYTGNNLADVNGDGKLDLVSEASSSDYESINFTIYLGQQDGSFAPNGLVLNVSTINVPNVSQGATSYSGIGLNSFEIADVNGDGRADLLFIPAIQTSYYGRSILCVSFGNANGAFAQPSCLEMPSLLTNPGTLPGGGLDFDFDLIANGLQVKDLNGDGKSDILYSYHDSDYGSSTIAAGFIVQPGNGDGTFGAPKILQLYSSTNPLGYQQVPQFALLADVNNDGRPDLITTLQSGTYPNYTTAASLNLNNGDGSFKPATTLQLGISFAETSILATDMNGDSKADLVVEGNDSSGNGNISICLGNGDGTFAQAKLTPISEGDETNGLALGDFNADGTVDVALLSYDNHFSGIYFGNGDGTLKILTDSYSDVLPDETIPLNVQGPAIAYDFDGDGKLDLLAGDSLLHAITAPSVSSVGTTASTTGLSAATTSATTGQSVAFSATVRGPAGTIAVPTGTITFLDGSTSLSTGMLDGSGNATFSTSSLAAGTHSITASYGGDTNFAASVSIAVTVTVTAVTADFSLGSSASSGTVAAVSPATATLTVTSSNGFASPVSFVCDGLPSNVACSFNPSTVTPAANGTGSTTITFTETASAGDLRRNTDISFAMGLGVLSLILMRRRRFMSGRYVAVVLFYIGIAGLLSGCGKKVDGGSKSIGPIAVTITAASGTLSHTTQYSLTISR